MDKSIKILSDIVVYMKYAKFLPEKKRRETWEEIIYRNRNMHLKKFPELREEIFKAYELVLEKKILPSMRALQFSGKPIEINPVRQFNCSATAIDHPSAFNEIMFLLLSGTGVGWSVQKHHVKKLPPIKEPVRPKDARQRRKRYLIPDSIEGWADAIKVLMSSYFNGSKDIEFDFRDIRPKGERLITSGGKAPGSQPLMDVIHNIRKILDSALEERGNNTQLKTLEVHDILCYIADCVLSGGIRRAAAISIFSLDDEDMLTCKFGNWWEENPQRARANNSVMLLRHKVKKEDFEFVWERVKASGAGEPGILFSNDKEQLTNPCQPKWATILTKEGLSTFEKIKVGDMIWSSEGWTTVLNKWSTGVKKVYKYRTNSGVFVGTETHRIVSKGEKIEVDSAEGLDQLVGNKEYEYTNHNPNLIMDGLVLGDGSVHKASNNLVYLYIGENDKDYFNSEISHLIGKQRNGLKKDVAFEIETGIQFEELPKTYERCIPDRYKFSDSISMASFLRGLYSANGSICGKRITYKTTSKKMVEDIQIMLSALGIASYFTKNKSSKVEWHNGDYVSRESFDINISSDRKIFFERIGFIQLYKMKKLNSILGGLKRKGKNYTWYAISEKEIISEEEVFDITVDNKSHTYWTGGVNVSNCAEVSLKSNQFCNLVEVNVSDVSSQEDFEDRIKKAAFINTLQAAYTDFHYLREEWQENSEKDALLGVSMTGIASGKVLSLDIKRGAEIVLRENERVSKLLGIKKASRTTTVKPSGTAATVLGCSSGIHAWHSPYYIRRIRVGKNEAIYSFLKKNHPEMIEDEFFKPKEQAVISIPIKAPEDSIYRDEPTKNLLERVKKINQDWIATGHRKGSNKHNVSVTVSVRDEEWDMVGEWMWENKEFYNGISVLPFDGGSYKQAPFEECSKEEYERLIDILKDVELTNMVEEEDNTDLQGEIACSGGACELK